MTGTTRLFPYFFPFFHSYNLSTMYSTISMTEKSLHYLELEEQYGAHNYHPIPVVLTQPGLS